VMPDAVRERYRGSRGSVGVRRFLTSLVVL